MPKFLVGCLIVLVVVVGAGGTAGYFYLVKPAYEFATSVQEFVTEYAELNEQVERRDDFQPPSSGAITSEQFQRFLVAQRDMRSAMESEIEELEQKLETMKSEIDDDNRDPDLTEIATAYKGLGELLLKAKRAQVEALNRYNFSLQEYMYVRNQTYHALGQEVAVAAFGDQSEQTRTYRVPEEVVGMVSPHREELMESYVFAWFGI